MNCYLHPETLATAYCRSCGRPLCPVCQRTVDGVVYCQDHVPVPVFTAPPSAGASAPGGGTGPSANPYSTSNPYTTANPYTQAAPPPLPPPNAPIHTSPVLAFILGFIPGVGAIYNGQYLKGLVHAVIFGLIISILNSADGSAGEPFLAMVMVGFIFYMPFEAYHTAKRRQMGLPVDEWSSLTGNRRVANRRLPAGPIVLIALGVMFLLDTLHLLDFRQISRYWPVLLIVVGIYMLMCRLNGMRYREPDQSYPVSSPYVPNAPYSPSPRRGNDQPVGATRDQ